MHTEEQKWYQERTISFARNKKRWDKRHRIWKELDNSGNITKKSRKIWIKWLKSSNNKYQQRHNDYWDMGKDKTSTIKIKSLEQPARNFTAFSGRKIPAWKVHQPEKKWRSFGKKYLGKKKVQQVQKLAGSKTNAYKISVWSGGQRYWEQHSIGKLLEETEYRIFGISNLA